MTLCEAGETVADLALREAKSHPDAEPKVNVEGIEEMVVDKGYHSAAVLERVKGHRVRSYIPERQQKGRRKWEGKASQQQAVYANRRRVQGNYGKSLLRRRGELVERSFAHCYDTGGMRRTHLRKHENIRKRQLVHVAEFNLSLIFRKLLGTGTPREWKNRGGALLLCSFLLCSRAENVAGDPVEARLRDRGRSALRRPCSKIAHGTAGKSLLAPRAARGAVHTRARI